MRIDIKKFLFFFSGRKEEKKKQSILFSITITFAKSAEEKEERFHQRNYIDLVIFLAVGKGRRGEFIVGDGAFFFLSLSSFSFIIIILILSKTLLAKQTNGDIISDILFRFYSITRSLPDSTVKVKCLPRI